MLRRSRQFCHDQVVGFAKERGDFGLRQGIGRFDGDPLSARQIRSGDDAGPFGQFDEFLGIGFEREPEARWLKRNYDEHFAAHLE